MRHTLLRALAIATLLGCGGARGPTVSPPPPATTQSDPWFSPSTDEDPEWVEASRETLRVGDVDLAIVLRTWEGEGAALIVLGPDGSTRGGYRFDFGGNGAELTIAGRCTTRDWVVLTLRAEGHARGYRIDPGQERCPQSMTPERRRAIDDGSEEDPCEVAASSEVTFAEIGIDAAHVWLVSAASSAAPERACDAPSD